MAKESRECTAFTVPERGLFYWKVMPFELHSAPATFQRALDSIIGPEMEPYAFAYLDDIVLVAATLEEHMRVLREVFRRLRETNHRLNPDKCAFFRKSITYLGHVISDRGIHTDPDKIIAVQNLKPPTTVKELRQSVGLASWYRRFVPNFADVVQPMTALLKKGRKWEWGTPQQAAFEDLKRKLTEAPVLACPDFNKRFTLQTDASDHGLGAVLTQEEDGQERVVAYASRRLAPSEVNYTTTEKELRCYLEGYEFTVVTDHLALKWLADALSRQPVVTLSLTKEETPHCQWWTRMMAQVKSNPNQYPDYIIANDQLYRRTQGRPPEEEYVPWKLCVPRDARARVLQECYDQPTAGHQGIRKTALRVAQRYYWSGYFRDVAIHVRCCPTCQQYKVSQRQAAGKKRLLEEVYLAVLLDRALPESSKVTPNTNAPAITFHEADTTETITTSQASTTTLIEVTSDNPAEASRDINPTATPTEVNSANPTEASRAITPSTPTPTASASSSSCTPPPIQGVTPTWTLSDDSGWDDEAETERRQSSPEENDEDQQATPLRLPQTLLDPGSRVGEGYHVHRRRREKTEQDPPPEEGTSQIPRTPGRTLPTQGH
ncbi:uncharacterized protein LOC122757821 [Drosophila mojavensis]|uniref:uncharacterized protein LOC122757821 n=1 Tax=Drosophila mojavensis TaxID=7230 RepID=UPI001CD0B08E|nr:uncharacterized protein LOC122757821 [Drosophila mojavensis]